MNGKRRYYSPRAYEGLVERGIPTSRKRVVHLMRENGLTARVHERFKCATMSEHDHPVAGNALPREVTADVTNERQPGDPR